MGRSKTEGGLKLIYIDPPFDVGADFSMDIEIGGDTFTKKPNILENRLPRHLGKGEDSFIAMIYERLILMRDLLAEDGSMYVHCDWRVNAFVRVVHRRSVRHGQVLVIEIIWKQHDHRTGREEFRHTVLARHPSSYSKTDPIKCNKQYAPYQDYFPSLLQYDRARDVRRYNCVHFWRASKVKPKFEKSDTRHTPTGTGAMTKRMQD